MKTTSIVAAQLVLALCAEAQLTERISVGPGGSQANFGGDIPTPPGAVVSADGRCVVFISSSDNLVPGDTNGTWDVFLRDRLTGTTERVSVDSNGAQGNGFSGLYGVVITPDGRFVAFSSSASNLVPGDTNGSRDVFVRDRQNSTTERVSLDSAGAQGNGNSFHLAITPDGRFVVFDSLSTNLVAADGNGHMDIFVRDRANGTTEMVSLATNGAQADQDSGIPVVSADGRFVAFESRATNLSPLDTNGRWDVFVRDRQLGSTTRVSTSSSGVQGDGDSSWSSISADGRFVTFTSDATNLVAGDTNNQRDVFRNDRWTAVTDRLSVGVGGAEGNSVSQYGSLSPDGTRLVFESAATNLVPTPPPVPQRLIYVRDLQLGTNELVSLTNAGLSPNAYCDVPWSSDDGRFVVFRSAATDLVGLDTNGYGDIFLRDRFAAGFASFCDPGTSGVLSCPCGNPPSSAGRGCDNSAATGGAAITASGVAYLAADSLVFTTSDERPSATSVLLQGNSAIPNGAVFGQGVRCAGGTLKRLYVKTAVNGSIAAPDFNSGDPTVSARSGQLGVTIQPGQPHYYLVYYRDPLVLGGCSAGSTFNATQTGSVTYWP